MTDKELWQEFIMKNNLEDVPYEVWAFSAEPDLLADLVVQGEKQPQLQLIHSMNSKMNHYLKWGPIVLF